MSRLWEIRENDDRRYSSRSKADNYAEDDDDAYECGFEDGYKKAMKEFRSRSRY